MSKKKKIVVIGGAHGGPTAAFRARQNNEEAEIILIEKNPIVTWVQANLSHYLFDEETKLNRLLLKHENYFKHNYNIDVRTENEALAIDMDSRFVLTCKNNKEERLAFDSLVFAGGAISKTTDIPNLKGNRVCNFRNLNDIKIIKEAMAEGAKNALIVGFGFYGVEAAIALMKKGLKVTIVDNKKRIFPKFSLFSTNTIIDRLSKSGINVLLGKKIINAQKNNNKGFLLELSDKSELEADLVVVCIGMEPRSSLLAEAGAALDANGLIRVDDSMATTLSNVFACGSAISVPHILSSKRQWLPHGAIIERTAMVAGFNAAKKDDQNLDLIKPFCGTMLLEIDGMLFASTGLRDTEAKAQFGADRIKSVTVFGNAAEEWLSSKEMCVRLIIDIEKNRIVGGEVFGFEGIARRIDLIATALMENWSVDKIINLDMAYEASVGPAFDPLKEAAMRAKLALDQKAKSISEETLALWLANKQDFCLIDVHDEPLLSNNAFSKTIHMPFSNIRSKFVELKDERKPIVFFSRTGRQSFLASQALSQLGVEDVYYLDGGIATWQMITKN